jgi:hypothetical protein
VLDNVAYAALGFAFTIPREALRRSSSQASSSSLKPSSRSGQSGPVEDEGDHGHATHPLSTAHA